MPSLPTHNDHRLHRPDWKPHVSVRHPHCGGKSNGAQTGSGQGEIESYAMSRAEIVRWAFRTMKTCKSLLILTVDSLFVHI